MTLSILKALSVNKNLKDFSIVESQHLCAIHKVYTFHMLALDPQSGLYCNLPRLNYRSTDPVLENGNIMLLHYTSMAIVKDTITLAVGKCEGCSKRLPPDIK